MKRFIAAVLVLGVVGWILGAFENFGDCDHCDGSVNFIIDDCQYCSPAFRTYRIKRRVREIEPLLVASFWGLIILSIPGGLVWSVLAVDCKVCRARGTLRLEATPPGEPRFEVQVHCPGCRGWGRLSALDSLLLRLGWE